MASTLPPLIIPGIVLIGVSIFLIAAGSPPDCDTHARIERDDMSLRPATATVLPSRSLPVLMSESAATSHSEGERAAGGRGRRGAAARQQHGRNVETGLREPALLLRVLERHGIGDRNVC